MRAAYVSIGEPLDPAAWSGTNRHIARALEAQGIELGYVGVLRDPYLTAKRLRWRAGAALRRPRYLPDRSHMTARSYARQVARRLREIKPDVVFATGTVPLAFLDAGVPAAFWADANFAAMEDFYPEYTNVAARSVEAAHEIERRGIARASQAIYASDWAARNAIERYTDDSSKVAVVPFGPNLDREPAATEIAGLARTRLHGGCRLLFLGVEWDRKGGDIAAGVARAMNEAGVETTLVVVGCEPPQREPFMECRGFVDKHDEAGREQLRQLLRSSTLLIHPARAEAYGLALVEAGAFGMPTLAAAVGGIPTIVREGRNGFTFPAGSAPEAYASVALELLGDPARYAELALSSFAEFEQRLNWRVAGRSVAALLRGMLERDGRKAEGDVAARAIVG